MRSIVLLAALVTIALALKAPKPGEPDPANRRFWMIPDDNGKIHLVDTKKTPKSVEPIDGRNVTFFLYTPLNKDEPVIFNANEFNTLIQSGVFDPSLPSLFATHGWGGSGNSNSVRGVKTRILQVHDLNVFCVDWSGPAGRFYTEARQHVNPTGEIVGTFIDMMINFYGLDPTTIHLMGHSLGGQMVGRIGFETGGRLGTIVGLDPAWPLFPYDDLEGRLDDSDAHHVQLIHVNSGFLGYPYSVGHADYHPNGGIWQPGCWPDVVGTCSHYLIKDMIQESYDYTFTSVRCDSYENYLAGNCNGNSESYWGGWPIDTSASGDYFLETTGEPPFVIQS